MGTDKIDTCNKGLCNKCLKIVTRLKNTDETCTCDCGERMNFHVAHLLLMEAIYQGRMDIPKRIVKLLPNTFLLSHGDSGIGSEDLLGCIKIKGIRKNLSLFYAVVTEGASAVNELILARQMDIKKKYGLEISRADAAAIIAFKNIMRTYEEDEGDLTRNIEVQNLDDLEKNAADEFALSFMDGGRRWIKSSVEGESISVCQPEVSVRYENDGGCVHAYIKSDLDIFVAVYRSINFPRGSKIYIFHKGAAAR